MQWFKLNYDSKRGPRHTTPATNQIIIKKCAYMYIMKYAVPLRTNVFVLHINAMSFQGRNSTNTSHERHGVRLKSTTTRLFVEQFIQANNKETNNAQHYWPFCERNHRFPYNGPVKRKEFSWRDVPMLPNQWALQTMLIYGRGIVTLVLIIDVLQI